MKLEKTGFFSIKCSIGISTSKRDQRGTATCFGTPFFLLQITILTQSFTKAALIDMHNIPPKHRNSNFLKIWSLSTEQSFMHDFSKNVVFLSLLRVTQKKTNKHASFQLRESQHIQKFLMCDTLSFFSKNFFEKNPQAQKFMLRLTCQRT